MGTFNANINNEDINEEWIIDELDCKNKYIKYVCNRNLWVYINGSCDNINATKKR